MKHGCILLYVVGGSDKELCSVTTVRWARRGENPWYRHALFQITVSSLFNGGISTLVFPFKHIFAEDTVHDSMS
jgi:hypothetical protein